MQRRRCTVLRISSPVASAPSDDVGRRAKSLAAASARIRAQPDDFAARDIWLAEPPHGPRTHALKAVARSRIRWFAAACEGLNNPPPCRRAAIAVGDKGNSVCKGGVSAEARRRRRHRARLAAHRAAIAAAAAAVACVTFVL